MKRLIILLLTASTGCAVHPVGYTTYPSYYPPYPRSYYEYEYTPPRYIPYHRHRHHY